MAAQNAQSGLLAVIPGAAQHANDAPLTRDPENGTMGPGSRFARYAGSLAGMTG